MLISTPTSLFLSEQFISLAVLWYKIGGGGTTLFWPQGRQPNFRGISTGCSRRRRKAYVAEDSTSEETDGNKLVFRIHHSLLGLMIFTQSISVYYYCIKKVDFFFLMCMISGSGKMRIKEYEQRCGKMLVLGESKIDAVLLKMWFSYYVLIWRTIF